MLKIDLDRFPQIKAIHILQNDKIIYNHMENYHSDELFPVGCIFKSLLSALVGVAIYEGRISSVEDKIADYYPNLPVDDNWKQVKIAHALSKTTGILWPGPHEKLPDKMTEVFELNIDKTPGTEFLYKPDPQIIAYLLEDIYGISITELANMKVLSYISYGSWSWNRENIQGLQVSIHVLDELGKIYLHKGMVGTNCIFDESYYELSTHEFSKGGFPEGLSYGLGWWTGCYQEMEYYMVSGFGGQILAVIPDKKIIVSILSEMDRPHPENKEIIHRLIESSTL